jgi:hypothetical protein
MWFSRERNPKKSGIFVPETVWNVPKITGIVGLLATVNTSHSMNTKMEVEMKKRYQAICIEKQYYTNTNHHAHVVAVYDRYGKEGISNMWYHDLSKTELIKALRCDGVEVSKHVENGGSLRLY